MYKYFLVVSCSSFLVMYQIRNITNLCFFFWYLFLVFFRSLLFCCCFSFCRRSDTGAFKSKTAGNSSATSSSQQRRTRPNCLPPSTPHCYRCAGDRCCQPLLAKKRREEYWGGLLMALRICMSDEAGRCRGEGAGAGRGGAGGRSAVLLIARCF